MNKRTTLFCFCLLLLLARGFPAFAQAPAQKAGSVTGSGSYSSYIGCFTMNVTGYGSVKVTVANSGTAWSGTIQAETSVGGGSPSNVEVTPDPNSPTPQATITANGSYTAIVAGSDLFILCGNTVTNVAGVTANAVAQVAINKGSSSASGVTSAALALPSWLTVTGSPITTSGTFTVTPTAAETSHQVIGTCGAGTTFAPCALVAGDIPTAIPIADVGSAGLSGTAPVTISAAGAIACATCATTTNGGAISFDTSATGLINPTADATFTYPGTSTTGLSLAGTSPASTGGSGTAASTLFHVSGIIGGGTTATGAATGGTGSAPTIVAGAGGAASGVGGNTTVGGAGGAIGLTTGAGGAGSAGNNSGGAAGNLVITLGAGGAATGSGTAGAPGEVSVVGSTVGGALTTPFVNVAGTWNTSGVANAINVLITNTASAAASCGFNLLAGTSAATQEACISATGNVGISGSFEGLVPAGNSGLFGGTGGASVAGIVGGVLAKGSDNTSASASAIAGYGIFRAGVLNSTPNAAALEGVVQVGEGYIKGAAVANVGDVLCGTTTAFNVTDCPTTPGTNIIGIATNTANPIGVVSYGTALVKLDGAITAIGDHVCMGTTTAGLAHDNGSATTACALGTSIGVIIADSGTVTQMSGATTASTAMSTTLVLVQLHIDN